MLHNYANIAPASKVSTPVTSVVPSPEPAPAAVAASLVPPDAATTVLEALFPIRTLRIGA